MTTIDPSNNEGLDLTINVRLDGQIFGAVDIELELLTVSEFEERNIGPLPVAAIGKDPAERKWHSWRIGKLLCPHSPHSLSITQLNVIIYSKQVLTLDRIKHSGLILKIFSASLPISVFTSRMMKLMS